MSATAALVTSMGIILAADAPDTDVQSLIAVIDALQQDVADFQCEYEGTITIHDLEIKATRKLDDDGRFDNYSGIFIWRRGGDINIDGLHRRQPDGRIQRERLVIRAEQGQAEQYLQDNDEPLGYAVILKPTDVTLRAFGSYAKLRLVEELKRLARDDQMRFEISEETLDDRPCKVVDVRLKGLDDSSALILRFWVDLGRSGHVVRLEAYGPGKVLVGRTVVDLDEFRVGDSRVWMPVAGTEEGFVGVKPTRPPGPERGLRRVIDREPIYSKVPLWTERVRVNKGSMEFNRGPGNEAFRIDYKPGTKISDTLRKLQTEFGRQEPGPRQTKREIEADLRRQVAEAERQGKVLVAAPSWTERDWSGRLVWVFGGCALVTSIALWLQRRGRSA